MLNVKSFQQVNSAHSKRSDGVKLGKGVEGVFRDGLTSFPLFLQHLQSDSCRRGDLQTKENRVSELK